METACPHAVKWTDQTKNGLGAGRLHEFVDANECPFPRFLFSLFEISSWVPGFQIQISWAKAFLSS